MHRSLFILALVVAGCSPSEEERSTVATTVYPIQFVAQEIGGSDARVVNVTPPGAEPHDVELGSEQVIDLVEADLVVYVGSDFQPAVEEGLDGAQGVTVDALEVAGGPLEDEAGEDAHFWLDPQRLAEVAGAVADHLAEVDPDHAGSYASRAEELSSRLNELDERFARELADCRSRNIVVSHEAFGYLVERYGLTQTGIAGLDPEAEVSPQRIADVIDHVRANNVRTIFFETLLPPDAARTIARETGAETSVLDPLESGPEEGDYFSAMQRNLANLREALECDR